MLRFLVVCGKTSIRRDPTLIVGGRVSEKGQFPWQAALYSSVHQSFLCGGTLLNEKVVLTGKFSKVWKLYIKT
jgi:secreted trypsin-like serine protease